MKMTMAMESNFKLALKKAPSLRTAEDLRTIYSHLYHMDVLSHLREHQLRSMCRSARYERHEANHNLFYPDTIASCWYILLTGSVFVKEHMYLARCCFGKQLGGRRGCECITLEPSEMIVVENGSEADESFSREKSPREAPGEGSEESTLKARESSSPTARRPTRTARIMSTTSFPPT
ncbi:hypothetical protein WMY93_007952 [Mugilogobius chulae]|uniref:Cyclic nucleotide-binding domain-containing protein n=1 Tax=Mugilogobius chulae TaxID=88201 RepID=A0AAW0PR19_9GOBI